MKLACQTSSGQWCGHLHPIDTPHHLLCQAAFLHRVSDDAVGPHPWDTPEPKRRGPPNGHPPYRPKVQTERIHLSLTPELKARIEADAATKGLTVNKWLRLAAEAVIDA